MERFNNILCVVEPQQTSHAAISKAVSLATSHQARLTVVATVQKPESLITFIKDEEEAAQAIRECIVNKKSALQEFVRQHRKDISIEIDILAGIQFIEIIKQVLKNGHDLVIKSPNDESWFNRLFGSDDMNLLRKCPCPVLMLKPDGIKPCRQILATVDLTESTLEKNEDHLVQEQLNQQVLAFASSFALAESAELHIGSVWSAYGEDFLRYSAFSNMPEDQVDQYVERTRKTISEKLNRSLQEMERYVGEEAVNYIHPKVHLVKGLPAKEIPIMAQKFNIDMIVMGTVARTGVPGLIIGNTAEAILEQVNCSVLAIKPPGFQCPVVI